MTVTAPSGAMTGFDDENTEVTREIPQSSYNISSDFGQFLTLQRPSPGMYEITLSGDSDSPYSVKVMNSGTDGTESTESLSGAISSAKPDRYGFEVSPNGEIELTAGPFNIPTVRYVTTILTILTGVFLVYWKDHV